MHERNRERAEAGRTRHRGGDLELRGTIAKAMAGHVHVWAQNTFIGPQNEWLAACGTALCVS